VMSATGGSTVSGGDGNDIISATDEVVANGGAGNDVLKADYSDDVITSPYEDRATLTGGRGADRFVIAEDEIIETGDISLTVITDFNAAQDALVFEYQTGSDFARSDLRVSSAFDSATNATVVTVSVQSGTAAAEVLTRIRLEGVTSFDAASLRIEAEPLGA
jgi:RTX calcium-binding nonapeptide repeat (4 copies)